MKSQALSLTLASLLALPSLVACQSGLGHGPLDGRVYQVTLAGPMDSKPDQLVFDGGRFESTACRTHGFVSAPYSAKNDGATASFEVAAKSDKAGATAWTGAMHGEAIVGKMILTDDKGVQSEYRFNGKKSSGPLDGQVFEGMICEGNDTTGDKDFLTFNSGAFDSSACRAHGFTMSPYSTTREGDSMHFQAEAINCSGEKNVWDGVVKDGDISGTLKHVNSSGKLTDSYKFVAKLVK